MVLDKKGDCVDTVFTSQGLLIQDCIKNKKKSKKIQTMIKEKLPKELIVKKL